MITCMEYFGTRQFASAGVFFFLEYTYTVDSTSYFVLIRAYEAQKSWVILRIYRPNDTRFAVYWFSVLLPGRYVSVLVHYECFFPDAQIFFLYTVYLNWAD